MKSTRIRSKNATQSAKRRANYRDRLDLTGYTRRSTSESSCLVRCKQRLAARRALREAVAEAA